MDYSLLLAIEKSTHDAPRGASNRPAVVSLNLGGDLNSSLRFFKVGKQTNEGKIHASKKIN